MHKNGIGDLFWNNPPSGNKVIPIAMHKRGITYSAALFWNKVIRYRGARITLFQVQKIRRKGLFRDRSRSFEMFNNVELYNKFRLRRQDIIRITCEVENELKVLNRVNSLSAGRYIQHTVREVRNARREKSCYTFT